MRRISLASGLALLALISAVLAGAVEVPASAVAVDGASQLALVALVGTLLFGATLWLRRLP